MLPGLLEYQHRNPLYYYLNTYKPYRDKKRYHNNEIIRRFI